MLDLGQQIKRLRQQKHLSQARLGKRTGIKRDYISRLERGKVKNPPVELLSKIAHEFNTPLSDLLFPRTERHSFQDILTQSEQLKQKIGFLKSDLQKLHSLLDKVDETELSLLGSESPSKASDQVIV